MQINTLKEISNFILNIIETSQIVSQYKNLSDLCQKAEAENNEELKLSVLEAKNQLVATLEEFNPQEWNKNSLQVLEKLEWFDLFGEKAIEQIDNCVCDESLDFIKFQQKIDETIKRFESFVDYLKLLLSTLEPLVKTDFIPYNLQNIENQHILKITYEKTIFIENLEQLEKFCRIWNQILSSFSLLTHEQEEDVKIQDIEVSSITFYVGLNTAKALSKAVFEALIKYQKIMEIKQLKQELERLQLTREDEIKTLLAEEEITTIDQITYTVINDLLVEYEWNNDYETENIYKQIQISLKQTINFIERGGFIDSLHFNDLKYINEKVIKIIKLISE